LFGLADSSDHSDDAEVSDLRNLEAMGLTVQDD
jgi:hypothetical protein